MHTCLLLFFITAFSYTAKAQANYIMKNDGSGNPVNTSKIFEYADGFIGIGTVLPQARLHITQPTSSPAPHYFHITQPGFTPPSTFFHIPLFTVAGNGNVGIGTDDPETMLQIQSRKTITSFDDDPFSQKVFYMTNKNDDDLIMASDMSYNDGTSDVSAAFLGVLGANRNDMLAFAVFTPSELFFPFSVLGDGTVALGIDIGPGGSTTPFSQLDIRKHNSYDYIMSVANVDNSESYLTVHNDGYVGIGYTNSGNATLQVITPPAATGHASVIITGDAPNDRYLFIGNGTNPSSADAYFSVKNTGVGIGTDAVSSSQLVIKGSSGTKLDLIETSSSVSYNAQIRFIDDDGSTVRHIITEDASGNLYIDAAFAGGNDKVKIGGELETTSNVTVNGTLTIIGSSANQFKVGIDGKVRAREIQVDLATIPDYVFDKNYNLPTIEQLQTFITTNKHLPNIPAECEYQEQGSISLGELNLKLLEKVEELSLYVIQLNERIKLLENE